VYALFAGFGFYLSLAVFYVWSLIGRIGGKWIQVPDMSQLKEISREFAVEDLQRALGDACVDAYVVNETGIDKKAFKSAASLWCLFSR
jgi:hypothetical protein